MLHLPSNFQFSASSLQDFADCPRRFQLRYMLQAEYPAPAAEPLAETESAIERGERFHLLMERHFRGLPIRTDGLDDELRALWDAFVAGPLSNLSEAYRRPEVNISVKPSWANGLRFTAKYDLLAYEPSLGAVIVDWKTSKRPRRTTLDRRLQTILCPLLLVDAAPSLFGTTLAPEQISLVYWFGGAPERGATEVFNYSPERYAADQIAILGHLERLSALEVEVFPLTADERQCRFCQYRGLCDRGRVAGTFTDADAEVFPDLDELREVILSAVGQDDFVL